ncbi:phage shock envelope stress response protein PspM [Actinophytocola sp.]|uniref:phage shock envelope stress response protein PspM n=1 Tax=Actinophytocola sp. TaxID=1872138 RepID=UPI002ED1B156
MARHEGSPARRTARYWFAVVWAVWWAFWTFVFLAMAVSQWTGWDPARDYEAAGGGVIIAVLTGGLTASGVIMARNSREHVTLPVRSAPPPRVQVERSRRLPRRGSAAREPMRRLTEAETALAELLRRLGDSSDGPPVPSDVVEDTWRVATDTATSLRAVAARLEAIELVVEQAPESRRTEFEVGAGGLRKRLDQGIDGYRELIGAVGRVLLASTPSLAEDELVEATERLSGLAEALDELSD